MSVFTRRSIKTAVLSRFLKVTIAALNIMNKVYKGEFALERSISMFSVSKKSAC